MTLTITISLPVTARARMATWRERGRRVRTRVRSSAHVLASAALVIAGLGGMLGGGALIGTWCLGLVLIAESAGAVWYGLFRDDGKSLPRPWDRTVPEILEAARRLP